MSHTLTMTIRVDADLWKRFERAASQANWPADEAVRHLMRVHADGSGQASTDGVGRLPLRSSTFGKTASTAVQGPETTIETLPPNDGQIDLEDLLTQAP